MTARKEIDFDLADIDIYSVLSVFDEGIIIADKTGRILFYNDALAKIDELNPSDVIGSKIAEIYNLSDEESMVMRCIHTGKPIYGNLLFYRTRLGKMANTICSVFPLFREGSVYGAACFVKDYKLLEQTMTSNSSSKPHYDTSPGNGTRYRFTDIVGTDETFFHALKMARLAANSPSPIMLYGETGTGKELFAQSIHNYSHRSEHRFVGINCAAIPENLLEGLLFGTARGAFTGAENRIGIFEQANGGTLFLDEVNAMPINLQSKLLRVLQEKKVRRVGASEEVEIDVKVISSVNTDPHQDIKNGILRMDLFYRLGVVFITIPALRSREGGIDLLTRHFINKNNVSLEKNIKGVSDEVMIFFKSYQWPGNVRELEHIIEGTLTVMENEELIQISHIPLHLISPDFRNMLASAKPEAMHERTQIKAEHGESMQHKAMITQPALKQNLPESQQSQEKDMIHNALIDSRGNVSHAARYLGISRQLLHYKIKKYGLEKDTYKQ